MIKKNFAEAACRRAQIVAFGGSTVDSVSTVTYDDYINKTKSTGTGTTTPWARARTRAYRSDLEEDMAALCEVYQETFDRERVARTVQLDMLDAIDAGLHPEVIALAMDDTARADRPSWAYTLAILRRCIREKIFTADDWSRQKESRSGARARRSAAATSTAAPAAGKDYTQRAYSDDQFAQDAIIINSIRRKI